eukprot:2456716-Pleurochrysis_carterae.AAC.2
MCSAVAVGAEAGRRGAKVAANTVKSTRASASAEAQGSDAGEGAEHVAGAIARARASGAQTEACAAAREGGVADLRNMRSSLSRS